MKSTEEILRFVALQENFSFIWATMNLHMDNSYPNIGKNHLTTVAFPL